MAPDKKTLITVTESGDAEIYNLITHEFIAKVANSAGPFRSIQLALFYDRQSLVLVHKRRPDARDLARHARVDVIVKLSADGFSDSFELQAIGRHRPNHVTHDPSALIICLPISTLTHRSRACFCG